MLEWMKFLPGFFTSLPSWNQTALAITTMAFVGTLFVSIINFARRQPTPKTHIEIPTDPLRIVLHEPGCWWHMGSIGGQPAMQISIDGHVTNVSTLGVLILQGRFLAKGATSAKGFVIVQNPEGRDFGMYMVPRGTTLGLSGSLWVQPPVAKEGDSIVGDLELTNQFGGVTRIPRITLKYK